MFYSLLAGVFLTPRILTLSYEKLNQKYSLIELCRSDFSRELLASSYSYSRLKPLLRGAGARDGCLHKPRISLRFIRATFGFSLPLEPGRSPL
jgi:hypothetical protein